MQTHSPLLPLLLGKDVLWKLVDGCEGTDMMIYIQVSVRKVRKFSYGLINL